MTLRNHAFAVRRFLRSRSIILFLLGFLCTGNPLAASPPSGRYLDPDFDPGLGPEKGPELTTIYSVKPTSSDQILAGGYFSHWNELLHPGLVRLHGDGSLDPAFHSPLAEGSVVREIILQPDSRILLRGDLKLPEDESTYYLMRLNADGSLDDTFTHRSEPTFETYDMAVPPDGGILIAGRFYTPGQGGEGGWIWVDANGDNARQQTLIRASYLTAILPLPHGGFLISSYGSRPYDFRAYSETWEEITGMGKFWNGAASTLGLDSQNKILVAGRSLQTGPSRTGYNLSRLLPSGTSDPAFQPLASTEPAVLCLEELPDGRILTGSYAPLTEPSYPGLISRFYGNGEVDLSWRPECNGGVETLSFDESSHTVLIGGNFTRVDGSPNMNIARLLLNDPEAESAVIEFSAREISVDEAAITLEVPVIRRGNLDQSVSVYYATTDLTAEAASDYEAASGILEFAPQQTLAYIEIPLLDDSDSEDLESFQINLTEPQGAELSEISETEVMILANDQTLGFTETEMACNELVGEISVTVTKSPGPTTGTVEYKVIPGTASGEEDYQVSDGLLSFSSNTETQSISITLLDDSLPEGTEFFDIQLANASSGFVLSEKSTIRIYIRDNDQSGHPGSGADGTVETLAWSIDPPDRFYVGGRFTRFNGEVRNGITRLHADGATDHGFNPGLGANSFVRLITPLPSGQLMAGGNFTQYDGHPAPYLCRLNSDGSLDKTFDSGGITDFQVLEIVPVSDGSLWIGGMFRTRESGGRDGIAHLGTDGSVIEGSLDLTFTGNGVPFIQTILPLDDGSMIAGGSFTSVHENEDLQYLIRILPNGLVDQQFRPKFGVDAGGIYIQSLALWKDSEGQDQYLVGGSFDSVNGLPRKSVVRLNPDGTVDSTFEISGYGPWGWSLVAEFPQRILVAGLYHEGTPNPNFFTFLSPDGSLSEASQGRIGANARVNAILPIPEGGYWVGGRFTQLEGRSRFRLGRYETDGSVPFIMPEFVKTSREPGGNLRFQFQLEPELEYVIEASEDFEVWTEWETGISGKPVHDFEAATDPARQQFFRIRQ